MAGVGADNSFPPGAGDGSESNDGGWANEDVVEKKLLLRIAEGKRVVDREELVAHITEAEDQRLAFLKLPITIIFFLAFILVQLEHENIADSSMVQRQLRGMLSGTTFEGVAYTSGHKDLNDIDTLDDVYLYLQEVVLPLFINNNSANENATYDDLHRVLRYNMLIGGVQLQQVRRKEVQCAERYPDLGPFGASSVNPILNNFNCYPWDTEDEECFGVWNNPDFTSISAGFCPDAKRNEAVGGRRLDFVLNGGGDGGSTKGARAKPTENQYFSQYLYEYEGLEGALTRLETLKEQNWIDLHTAWLGIRLLVLNPDMGVFVHMTVGIYFPPSGALLPHIRAKSFQPEPYQSQWILALDVFQGITLLCICAQTMQGFYNTVRKRGKKELFLNGWNWLNLLVVLGGLVIILMWILLYFSLDTVKQKAVDVRQAEPSPLTSDEAAKRLFEAAVQELHKEMNDISDYIEWYRLILCAYTLAFSLKFLESFAAQPRLAVVTDTMIKAGSDLIHFLIVFSIIFLSYCVAGVFLFGRRIWKFSSLSRAIPACALIMLGDFDWEEMAEQDPTTSALWFWSFMICVAILMLNMLMAIVMDQYTQVKSEAEQSHPIWQQVSNTIVDAYKIHSGQYIGNNTLLKAVREMPEREVDEETLRLRVDNLCHEQAKKLIEEALQKEDARLNNGITITEAMKMIGWVKVAVKKIGWKLESMITDPEEHAAEDCRSGTLDQNQQSQGGVDGLLGEINERMSNMDEFMQESLRYVTFRGKDVRDRLISIEGLLKQAAPPEQTEADLPSARVVPVPVNGQLNGERTTWSS